jgi:hypothetical protein
MDDNLLNLFSDQPKDIRREILKIYYSTYYETHWPCGAKNDQKLVFIDKNNENNENVEIDHIKIRFNYLCSNCKSKHMLSANMFNNYIPQFYKEFSNIAGKYRKFLDKFNLFIEYVKYMNYKKLFNKDNYIEYSKQFLINSYNFEIDMFTKNNFIYIYNNWLINSTNFYFMHVYERDSKIFKLTANYVNWIPIIIKKNEKISTIIYMNDYFTLFKDLFFEKN